MNGKYKVYVSKYGNDFETGTHEFKSAHTYVIKVLAINQ